MQRLDWKYSSGQAESVKRKTKAKFRSVNDFIIISELHISMNLVSTFSWQFLIVMLQLKEVRLLDFNLSCTIK